MSVSYLTLDAHDMYTFLLACLGLPHYQFIRVVFWESVTLKHNSVVTRPLAINGSADCLSIKKKKKIKKIVLAR